MAGRPNFFYFQYLENTIYLVIYGNVCEKRNFIPTNLEETEKGFRVSAQMDSWYYLPFQGDGPATSDWWAMDKETANRYSLYTWNGRRTELRLDGSGA